MAIAQTLNALATCTRSHWLCPVLTQHIMDNALQYAIVKFAWWEEWQAAAKSVCQWLHSRANRDLLSQMISASDKSVEAEALIRTLQAAVPAFAHWRWNTLTEVTAGSFE